MYYVDRGSLSTVYNDGFTSLSCIKILNSSIPGLLVIELFHDDTPPFALPHPPLLLLDGSGLLTKPTT